MKQIIAGAAALMAAAAVASTAGAATVVVTDTAPQGWASTGNTGGGSSAITGASARSGNGSIELHGDRTRFVLGDLFSSASNLGSFSDFLDLAFDYQVDAASVSSCCDQKYSPALRLVVWDGVNKYDYVWEQAYQAGAYGAAGPQGAWNTVASGGTFYLAGAPSPLDQRTLATWGANHSNDAYVGAVYIGVGSGIGAGYKAYADNIVFGGDTYNFEVAVVPEPGTWAMMILGFGAAGSLIRRRRAITA